MAWHSPLSFMRDQTWLLISMKGSLRYRPSVMGLPSGKGPGKCYEISDWIRNLRRGNFCLPKTEMVLDSLKKQRRIIITSEQSGGLFTENLTNSKKDMISTVSLCPVSSREPVGSNPNAHIHYTRRSFQSTSTRLARYAASKVGQ